MAILDEQGIGSLTLRSLAADLQMSTIALFERIESRDNLLGQIATIFANRLDLTVRVQDSWRSTSLAWSLQLRNSLTAHPHVSNLLSDGIVELFSESIGILIGVAVGEGIARARAAACLRSLVRITLNDARAEIRAIIREGPRQDDHRAREDDFVDTMGLLLDGTQERSRSKAPIRSASTGPGRGRTPLPDRTQLATMDRSGQASLAWALVDAAKPHLQDEARVWLVTKLGAGDLESAIVDLLRCLGRNGAAVPVAVSGQIQRWLNGYVGSDSEAFLRSLVHRIHFI